MRMKYLICPCCHARSRLLKPGEKKTLEALEEAPLRFKDLLVRADLSASGLSPYLKGLIAAGYLEKDDDGLYAQSEAYRKGALDRFCVIDRPGHRAFLQSSPSGKDFDSELREELADLEHRQWAHWTRYMLGNLTPENIERWKRQTETPYNDLSEKEKDSDREWANEVMTLQVQFKILTRARLNKEERDRAANADREEAEAWLEEIRKDFRKRGVQTEAPLC